jgi:hypothetical protein
MAEQSKFAGVLGKLNKRPPEASEEPEQPSIKTVAAIEPRPAAINSPAAKARRLGKRSDPEFSPTTFFVRKETKRKAARLLEDKDTGEDLSDLVEQLLSKWVAKHSNV